MIVVTFGTILLATSEYSTLDAMVQQHVFPNVSYAQSYLQQPSQPLKL
jgi:hypothetical protein